jgi:signal transduction histidine kinase/serine/threonine protein kinase
MIIDSRYKVLRKLGSGIWATVYKVQDLRTNEVYALKLFQMLEAESLYERFSAENMHQITKLQHPNLVQVVNFGNSAKHIYYLSEYFQGRTLSSFVFRNTNLELLYDITVQICYALSALHSQNVIHLDLKPDNVVYRIEHNLPVLKVMDYGFTKIDVERSNQKAGKVLPYIAPEVYLGQKPVKQSDFYSLGAILYKLVTGTLPYTVEQISAIMAGDRHNLFPKFPRELNPALPQVFEQLILKLLEKEPKDRFPDVESIISYINSIQPKKYQYSRRLSIVNMIQFSDYIAREDYAHQLLDYIPQIEKGNGKVITLTAGKGLGKNNILTLFRYHILTDKYFIFDYECSEKHQDPFFALIKEFYKAVENNAALASDLSHISQKLREYLFDSETEAAKMIQNKEELDLDFRSASGFIHHLSELKPLIFIIRAAENLSKEVFNFVNFISRDISERPIMMIMSTNDPGKLENLIHSIRIKIDPLDINQTKVYINRLLKQEPPQNFIEKIWERSNGNPLFIEKILIDLTEKRKIWVVNKFRFDIDLDSYKLPESLIDSIKTRIDHISSESRNQLARLSVLHTPMANDIIKYLLDIEDKELFFFLKETISNELIYKKDEYYFFTFREIRDLLNSEITAKKKKEIASKVLSFFNNITITDTDIAENIIAHASQISDYNAMRKYKLMQVNLFSAKGEQEKAFNIMCDVLQLDFSRKFKLSEVDLRKDLNLLLDKTEWAIIEKIPDSLKKAVMTMPDIAEKHLIIGTFYYVAEKYSKAQKRLERAYELSYTGFYRIYILLKLSYLYFLQGKMQEMQRCIEELENWDLSDEFHIQFITYKALFMGFSGKLDEAIQEIEDFLPMVKSENDDNYFIRLGNLHNILGILYHKKKSLEEAEKNFETARKIWEKVNYFRKLGISYNNIGDIALSKGDTQKAFEYFRKALRICTIVGCKRIKVQGLLNHGEAYIKLGIYNVAEKYLNEALKLSLQLETKPFLDSIIYNIAISRSKVINFAYYYNFIKENEPSLLKGVIKKITPLTKTYFYYLYEIGDYDKISHLLQKYKSEMFESREHEFYYQMLGFLHLKKENYDLALENIQRAFDFSKIKLSDYALTINYLRLVQCCLGLKDYQKAYNYCQKAEKLSSKHNFRYWETVLVINRQKIQLLDENISLRTILRTLLGQISYVQDNRLFLLEIEIYEIIIQIYCYLNIYDTAEKYFLRYKTAVAAATEGLPEYDRNRFFEKKHYFQKDFRQFKNIVIKKRMIMDNEAWQEELFDILKLKELSRMKFLIDKTIQRLFSPAMYAIVLREELEDKKNPFLQQNFNTEKLYSKKYLNYMFSCLEKNVIMQRKIMHNHVLFVPLRIKTAEVGCLILTDNGEIPFQEEEKSLLKVLKLHLTTILMRINEFAALNNDLILLNKLIHITSVFFSLLNVNRLEQEIVSFILDFMSGTRGFLIKKDKFENYVYKVAMDDSKHLLKSYAYVSKTLLLEVQKLKHPIFIENVHKNKIFAKLPDHSEKPFSIYCAPLMVDGSTDGYLYIDNYNSETNKMNINPEFMSLLLIQISTALKNAHQYEHLMLKNQEIITLEKVKKDFINVASHELKTPLSTLHGYLANLQKSSLAEQDRNLLNKVMDSVIKSENVVGDLINFHKYLITSELDKSRIDLKHILKSIIEEKEKIASARHMQFKLEVEDNLPPILLNIEAFELMMHHIIINAIKYTKDFGTITLGARTSAFQQEEIEDRETIVISVQDNGIGIPETELDKVFEKFYELSRIESHKSGGIDFKSSGLGLGLSLVDLIVKLHHGKIWLNSKENEGTTVFIALPQNKDKI